MTERTGASDTSQTCGALAVMVRRAAVAVAVVLVSMLVTPAPAWAATRTWKGGQSDPSWSNPANWVEGVVPTDGDSVVLTGPGSGFGVNSIDNLEPGTLLTGIEFTGIHRVSGGWEKVLAGPIVLRAPSGAMNSPLVLATDVEVRAERVGTGGSGLALGDVYLEDRTALVTGDTTVTLDTIGPGRLVVNGPSVTASGDGGDIAVELHRGSLSAVGDFGPVTVFDGYVGGRGTMTSFTTHGGHATVPHPSFGMPWIVTGDVFFGGASFLAPNIGADGSMVPLTARGAVRLDSAGFNDTPLIFAGREEGRILTLIDKQSAGPVEGTFRGLPEGSIISVPNAVLRLSYAGGDGNDVTLTVLDAGYAIVNDIGWVYGMGNQPHAGQIGFPLTRPIVGMDITPSRQGYWLTATDGGIFSFGDAGYFGSTGAMVLNKPIVAMATTPAGRGYWLVASDGGIFSFGDAAFFGSTGDIRLNSPIVGMAASPTGGGYWLVASDGGIFAFGDAAFHGSTGAMRLNRPIVGMAAARRGDGYWLTASDGGVFAFGNAPFHGSTGDIRLNSPIVAMASSRTGNGYWFMASDGGVFAFGDAPFLGSALQREPRSTRPFVAIAS